MKQIAIIAMIGFGLMMGGCASMMPPNQIHLSQAEKQRIKDGKDVEFTRVEDSALSKVEVIDSSKLVNGIYVCAVPTNTPTDSTPCYPHLSAYVGKFLSDVGAKLANSREGADAVLYIAVSYSYLDTFPKTGQSGDFMRTVMMETADKTIAEGKGPILPMDETEAVFNQEVKKQNVGPDKRNVAQAAGYVALAIIGTVLGGPAGGLQVSQSINGFAHVGQTQMPGLKLMSLLIHEKIQNPDIVAGTKLPLAFWYEGQHDMLDSFGKLFPSAVKMTVDRFVTDGTSTVSAK